MKKTPLRPISSSAAAILSGGILFTGPASAAVIFSEGFEGGGGAGNAFSMPVYTYAQNYTMPAIPGSGTTYAHGGAGVNGSISTNTFPGPNVSLTGGTGFSAAQIDGGLVSYDLSAQFSTYRDQNDFAEVQIQFRDGANSPIGSPVTIGSFAFASALPFGDNGSYANAREWAADALVGIVPAGARSVDVTVFETKQPPGTVIDGYLDNISLSLNAVPEPGTVALSGLAGLVLLRRRRA